MKLTFLGGANEVGASCTLVEMGGRKILVDAGIRISPKTSRGLEGDQLPHLAYLTDVGQIDAILVTHAHTDHVGALPQVMRSYPRIPVYGTAATIALSRVLLLDSTRLMGNRFEAEGELPLYDLQDVERLFNNWQPVEFKTALKLGADLSATYYPSGHIAGAGMILLESTEGNLMMGGDMSLSPQRTVVSAKPPRRVVDALVLETTYGGRAHANRQFEEQRLIDTLVQITEGGGSVLIPAFALGRAQEVIQILLANHKHISAPVYADGMVRAMCEEYENFRELLPKPMLKLAQDRPLFFRDNVHAVKSREQRESLMRDGVPKIIIASSGMLTGGASVAYASALAGDPRNAILLTGYQDEESPGRFLQNLVEKQQQGETPILRFGEVAVPVRCHIGRYSLSAHADESELISIVEAINPRRVYLVHGDDEARSSIWRQLQLKERVGVLPKVGQEKNIAPRRKTAVRSKAKQAENAGESPTKDRPTAEELWKLVKPHEGEFFTARELSQLWYGDVEREADIVEVLEEEKLYFARDWRMQDHYAVRKAEQVERMTLGRTLMAAFPNLTGQIVMMRNSNNQPRLGVVTAQRFDGFEGIIQGGDQTSHPGFAFVWALGEYTGGGLESKGFVKRWLNDLHAQAEAVLDQLMPFEMRQILMLKAEEVNPDAYITAPALPFPDGEAGQAEERRLLVERTAVVLALVRDGAEPTANGLRVLRALPSGPLPQQAAYEAALKLFPPEARLRKTGMFQHQKRLLLTFDFPEAALKRYASTLETLKMETGWDVDVKRIPNQQALTEAIREVLPEGIVPLKTPSLFMADQSLLVELEGISAEQVKQITAAYEELTGWRLKIKQRDFTPIAIPSAAPTPDGTPQTPANASPMAGGFTKAGRMEINYAYAFLKQHLEPLGLQRLGLKGSSEIMLTFITPQVGERYRPQFEGLAQQCGYLLTLNPSPLQNLILDEAKVILRTLDVPIVKGPGIHIDRLEVSVRFNIIMPDEQMAALSDALEAKTGYRMVQR
ncbi:MAG: MBL fold metallo-hydrolase [Phototrophicaceae bacterium]